jgi:hypothetical protein
MADEKGVTELVKPLAHEASARKRIEFLVTASRAFLEDFLTKALANDSLGTIVAAARVAQLGAIMCAEYETCANGLVESATEQKVANQAAAAVVTLANKNAEACAKLRGTELQPLPAEESMTKALN